MLNFMNGDNFKSTLFGSIILGCAGSLYYLTEEKKLFKQQIELVKQLKIYELDEFLTLQSRKMANQLIKENSNLNQEKNQKDFLIKLIPKASRLTIKKDIYSNQVYFCPPSINLMFKDSSEQYNNEFTFEFIPFEEVTQRRQQFFKGYLLTEKFQFKTSYDPRQKYQISNDPNKNIFQKLKEGFYWLSQKAYQFLLNFSYCCQKVVDTFNFGIRRRRSNNQNRFPLFKGVWAGILTANFIFLNNTYFLLKVRVEDNQIYTSFFADNKMMIIDRYKFTIDRINILLLLGSLFLLLAIWNMAKLHRRAIKRIWLRLTTKKNQRLNPKSISDDKLCQICYINCRNVLFYGCRHFIVCEDCFQHLEKQSCIICNTPLEKAQLLYQKSH